MTFQWVAVATFLYAEIAILLFLCIPTISPLRWQKIFMFSLWRKIANYGNKAFLAIIILLIVLFLDAVREVRKYSGMHVTEKSAMNAAGRANTFDHIQMKLFRAQRNLYISGFSLFLWLILRRTISLLIQLAGEMRSHRALETQVAEASETARQSLIQNEKLKESLKKRNSESGNVETNKLKQEIEELKRELKTSKNDLNKKADEITAFKKQHENLRKQYDTLSEVHQKLLAAEKSVDEKQKKDL